MEHDLADFVQYEKFEEPSSQPEADSVVGPELLPQRAHRIEETAIATICCCVGLIQVCAAGVLTLEEKRLDFLEGILVGGTSLFWFRGAYRQLHPAAKPLRVWRWIDATLCGLLCYICVLRAISEHTAEHLVPFLICIAFAIFGALACLFLPLPKKD